MAEPSVKTISAPSNIRMITIGASHHFFRTLIKSQNSLTIPNLLNLCPLNFSDIHLTKTASQSSPDYFCSLLPATSNFLSSGRI